MGLGHLARVQCLRSPYNYFVWQTVWNPISPYRRNDGLGGLLWWILYFNELGWQLSNGSLRRLLCVMAFPHITWVSLQHASSQLLLEDYSPFVSHSHWNLICIKLEFSSTTLIDLSYFHSKFSLFHFISLNYIDIELLFYLDSPPLQVLPLITFRCWIGYPP